MWNRIDWADWAAAIPVIAFVLTAGVFAILVTRAILMKKSDVDHRARLPLDDDAPDDTNPKSAA